MNSAATAIAARQNTGGVRTLIPTARPPSKAVLDRLTGDDRELLAQILSQPCEYVQHPSFTKTSAERLLFGGVARLSRTERTWFHETLPGTHTGALDADSGMRVGAMSNKLEQSLFQRFNYARYRVFRILETHQGRRLPANQACLLLAWMRRALAVRSQIVQINVPLVLAMAKRTRLAGVDFGELVSEGNMALLRSVEKFDCTRGFKFSTYACRAILKSFARVAIRTSRYRGRFPAEFDPTLEKSDLAERKRGDAEQDCVSELRDILENNTAQLSDVERTVIRERFALDAAPADKPIAPKTLEQVGALIGVTKERVRQIQNKALRKIRSALEESILAA